MLLPACTFGARGRAANVARLSLFKDRLREEVGEDSRSAASRTFDPMAAVA